jgi:atypical dual specificity phosphatase
MSPRSILLILLTACAPPPEALERPRDQPVEESLDISSSPEETEVSETTSFDTPVRGFSWVDENLLAGMALPGGYQGQTSASELGWLLDQGVVHLVSLTETNPDPVIVTGAGLQHTRIPIPDFHPPTPEQIDTFIALVDAALAAGEPVGVHCHAGLGRTGTMLATWFVYQGMTAQDAIDHVRALRPHSIETATQEAAIETYAQRLAREQTDTGK